MSDEEIIQLHRQLADYHAEVAAIANEAIAKEYHALFADSLRDYAGRLEGITPTYSA